MCLETPPPPTLMKPRASTDAHGIGSLLLSNPFKRFAVILLAVVHPIVCFAVPKGPQHQPQHQPHSSPLLCESFRLTSTRPSVAMRYATVADGTRGDLMMLMYLHASSTSLATVNVPRRKPLYTLCSLHSSPPHLPLFDFLHAHIPACARTSACQGHS